MMTSKMPKPVTVKSPIKSAELGKVPTKKK
jgi:hypothetical protein